MKNDEHILKYAEIKRLIPREPVVRAYGDEPEAALAVPVRIGADDGWFDDGAAYNNYQPRAVKEKRKRGPLASVAFALMLLAVPLFIGIGLAVGVQVAEHWVVPRLMGEENRMALYLYDSNFPDTTSHIAELNNTDTPSNSRFIFSYADLVDVIKPSVVTINTVHTITRTQFGRIQSFNVQGAGTGFIFDATETTYYIATNAHVIDRATSVTVSINGSAPLNATPVGKDIENDLAVIAVSRVVAQREGIHSVSVAVIGNSDRMRVGDIVLAVGNSLGEGIVVTDGIISALNRRITLETNITLNVMQTNAAINQGNSGGPLVNLIGEVIGVNTAKASQSVTDGSRASIEGTGYAIPSNVVRDVLVKIMGGEISAAAANTTTRLGIRGQDVNEEIALRFGVPRVGAYVSAVEEFEAAYKAGVLAEDIITAVNGRQVADFESMRAIITSHKPGDEVTLTILRNGTEVVVLMVKLGSSF